MVVLNFYVTGKVIYSNAARFSTDAMKYNNQRAFECYKCVAETMQHTPVAEEEKVRGKFFLS